MARYWREDSSLFWAHICLILLVNGAKMESRDIGFYYHYSPPPLLLVSLYGSYGGLFTFPAHEACRKLFYLSHYKALNTASALNVFVTWKIHIHMETVFIWYAGAFFLSRKNHGGARSAEAISYSVTAVQRALYKTYVSVCWPIV